ncbi:MAG: alternative ribosome rescue aminoacyl-tRNA hydrolase ArfB [Chloroflexota bacterium]
MIQITPMIAIDERDLIFEFVRSSGPGGQNVNKVATAVQLRFDVTAAGLPLEMRDRLARLAGQRLTQDGLLLIEARRFRTQEQNRQDALDRLAALLRRAAQKPTPRRKTNPTLTAKERRLAGKRRRSQTKQRRGSVRPIEE